MSEIYLDDPNVGELEKKYISECIDSGFVSTFGPFVPEFEQKFSDYLGVKKAVAVQSGTVALHIALYELGIETGDEVIVPALTFVATVNPILYVGALPVFVDVDRETWNIDPQKIKENISEKTKAIIPVHLYGNPCKMDDIMKIAKDNDLMVIEDAAESLGASYNGKMTGTFGHLGCFSFNGNKTITTGGGGMVVGNDLERLEHIHYLVNQAKDVSRGYFHSEIGFNYRMTNIEASLGLAQMKKLEEYLDKKKSFYEIYKSELGNNDQIKLQVSYNNSASSNWFSCATFENGIDITEVQKLLQEKGIPSIRVFMPVTEFPPYKKYLHKCLKYSYWIYENGICLPSSTLNSENDIIKVCSILKKICHEE